MASSPTAVPIMTSQQFLEHSQGHRALTPVGGYGVRAVENGDL